MNDASKTPLAPPTSALAVEAVERLQTGKIACWLVILLMPAGILLDYFVYGDSKDYKQYLPLFLGLRLTCSALAVGLLALHFRNWEAQEYRLFGIPVHRLLGLPIALLPAFFISWMIMKTEGFTSPYYAGLNLIVLAVSVVVRWAVWESVIAVLGVAAMYTLAGALQVMQRTIEANGEKVFEQGDFYPKVFNNYYFLILTAIIVVAGNYYFNRLRQELSRVRDQLAQAEKMASLGQMSAGVAHEFGNALNVTKMGLEALRRKSRFMPEEKRADYVETVDDTQDGVDRAENIVSNLRIFTHPMFMRAEVPALGELSAREVVADAIRGVSHLVREPLQVVNEVAEGQTIRADRIKLVQVVENLIRNSVDALATKPMNGETPKVLVSTRASGKGIALVVRDNGPGISPADQAKVFDPFFTTKDVGKGMGLGLTVCQGIMQTFGGGISVESEPGKYCEFLLEFPRQA